MRNIIKFMPGHNSWCRWIVKRVRNNLNFVGAVVGGPGTGKTYFGTRLAELISKEGGDTFGVYQICFDFKSMMELINDEEFKKKKIKIIIWDEPQTTIDSRTWQSMINKQVNYLLSTYRHQNIILIFCFPFMSMLDSNVRKMITAIFEMQGVDRKKKISSARPKLLQYTQWQRDPYQHPLYTIHPNNVYKPLRVLKMGLPSKELLDKYEVKKKQFTSKLNKEILQEIELIDKKKQLKLQDKRKALTQKQKRAMELLATMNMKEAAKIMGVSIPQVHYHKKLATNKGYTIDEFKEGGFKDI